MGCPVIKKSIVARRWAHCQSQVACYSLRIPAMHEANTALLDILVVGFEKDALLAELQARMSRSCRFCCFLPHT